MNVSSCLFCDCALFSNVKIKIDPDPDKQKTQLLLQMFSKYFCLDFNIMTQFDEEESPPDKLPFCPKCESSLVNLSELHCQLAQVKLNILTTVSKLSREIIESTNHNNRNNSDSDEDEEPDEEEEEELGQGLLHFDMTNPKFVKGYRRAMYQILSPKIILSPVHLHNFQPQPPDYNTNDNCNDFSNANHSHHDEEEEEQEEEEEEIPVKKFKSSNNEEEDNNIPVNIKTEASAQMNLDLFLQGWQQQNHETGIKTEDPLNYIHIQEPEDSYSAQDFVEMEMANEEETEEEKGQEQQNTTKNVIKNRFSFRCSICPKKPGFRSNALLKRHLNSHVLYGNGPFKCTYENCTLILSSRGALSKHEKSHENGLMPCHLCGTKFKSARDFKVHENEVHDGPAVFFCQARSCCHCTFYSEKELEKHMEKNHEEGIEKPFKCNYADCKEGFDNKSELYKHLAIHMI